MLKINTLAYWTAMGAVILALGSSLPMATARYGRAADWVHRQNGYYNYPGRAFAHGHLDLSARPLAPLDCRFKSVGPGAG